MKREEEGGGEGIKDVGRKIGETPKRKGRGKERGSPNETRKGMAGRGEGDSKKGEKQRVEDILMR